MTRMELVFNHRCKSKVILSYRCACWIWIFAVLLLCAFGDDWNWSIMCSCCSARFNRAEPFFFLYALISAYKLLSRTIHRIELLECKIVFLLILLLLVGLINSTPTAMAIMIEIVDLHISFLFTVYTLR